MSAIQFSKGLVYRKFQEVLDRATNSPEYFARLVMVFTTLVLLLIPDMLAMGSLLMDILNFKADAGIPMENYLFEGCVVLAVFTFAMMIIWQASAKQEDLQYVMVLIAFAMVSMGGGVLGRMSNSCIPDQQCDGGKFILGIILVTGITATGYFIPRLARQWAGWLGIVFLAVAVWSSELWLWVSIDQQGIAPSWGAVSGLAILGYAVLWAGIFAGMPRPKPPQPLKKR